MSGIGDFNLEQFTEELKELLQTHGVEAEQVASMEAVVTPFGMMIKSGMTISDDQKNELQEKELQVEQLRASRRRELYETMEKYVNGCSDPECEQGHNHGRSLVNMLVLGTLIDEDGDEEQMFFSSNSLGQELNLITVLGTLNWGLIQAQRGAMS